MFDITHIVQTAGYLGIFAIIFAESGLFFGLFLPGDSLLFTAGILASQGHLSITIVIVLCFLGAVLGDSFGYFFGKKVGPRIFTKEDSWIFNKKHILHAEKFYREHGSKTIIFARFIPIVRTFAPIVAGIGSMPYKTFLTYNIIGGVLWGVGLPALGYFLGNSVPNIDRYLIPGIVIIIFVSLIPPVIHFFRRDRV